MNEETRQFLEDTTFDDLYEELYQTHKPQKPKWKYDNLKEIGRIIVQFQRVEMTVQHFICMMLNVADNRNMGNILTENFDIQKYIKYSVSSCS